MANQMSTDKDDGLMGMRLHDVSVIVPHYAGDQVLECLDALFACPDRPSDVILVDDASTDGTTDEVGRQFPAVRIVRNLENLGFVGACNRGLIEATQPVAVLLNDDALVEPSWLDVCVAALENNPEIAAVQPKIVTVTEPDTFEYAGAAGGMMDRFGYPYALGRWFETVEKDFGQYDTARDIFWASGVAMVVRRQAVEQIGALDPAFGMHMEEIDWCWRARLAGWRVVSAPAARVRHYGARTLHAESPRKMYLNHRNSLMMLLKNYTTPSLLWIVPIRIMLELLTILGSIVTGRYNRAQAAMLAPIGVFASIRHIKRERARIATLRVRTDREITQFMYSGSIALRRIFGRGAPSSSMTDVRQGNA
jgi:GT2 family glycosyltransferase